MRLKEKAPGGISGRSTRNALNFILTKQRPYLKPCYFRVLPNFILHRTADLIERVTPKKFIRRKFVKPLAANLQINRICNLRCPFCFFNINNRNKQDHDKYNVTPDKFKEILSRPLLSSLIRFGITGGEPFLNEHVFDFIAEAKKRIPIVTVNTNFSLAPSVINDLNSSALSAINISFYDENEKTVREYAGRISKNIFKRLSFLIIEEGNSFHRVGRMYEVARMAVEMGFQSLYFQDYLKPLESGREHASSGKKDHGSSLIDSIREERKKIEEKFSGRIDIVWPAIVDGALKKASSPKCRQPDIQIGLDGLGNLAPCCAVNRSAVFGNIFSDDTWNSDYFLRIRKGLKVPGQEVADVCEHCDFLYLNLQDR